MTFIERYKLILWALGLAGNPLPKPKPARVTYSHGSGVAIFSRAAGLGMKMKEFKQVDNDDVDLVGEGSDLRVEARAISRFRVLSVQCQDAAGELTAVIQKPDGTTRTVTFDASDRFNLPPEFQLVQVGSIGGNVKLDSPNDSPGAVVAQAMRRFNNNVLRKEKFRATVSDEVGSIGQMPKVSTVWVAFGEDVPGTPVKRQRLQITVERVDQEPPELPRQTPLVAMGKGGR